MQPTLKYISVSNLDRMLDTINNALKYQMDPVRSEARQGSGLQPAQSIDRLTIKLLSESTTDPHHSLVWSATQLDVQHHIRKLS